MNIEQLISELFLAAERGDLTEVDTDAYLLSIISFASHHKAAYDDDSYKIRIKKFRKALSNFNSKLDATLGQAEITADKLVKVGRDSINHLKSLPMFAQADDNKEILKFINGLKEDKETYNFSEAQELTGVTRQTLKGKIDKGFMDIKPVYKSKVALLKKEDLIKLYRHYHNNDTSTF